MSETKITPERYQQLMQEVRLLDKLRWNYTDIKDFFHCCASRGVAIKKAAIEAGADYVIVGRAIYGSDDPAGTARAIAESIADLV